MHDQANLSPLETLFETKHGRALRLTPNLTRLYGNLRMPQAHSRQHVFSNFVSTLDGVVSLQARGHAGGADILGLPAVGTIEVGKAADLAIFELDLLRYAGLHDALLCAFDLPSSMALPRALRLTAH